MSSESSTETDGLVDTNVFLHAQTTDAKSAECRAFLKALELGNVQARLEVPVLHELSYALPRYMKQFGRRETAAFLQQVIEWPGISAEKDLLLETMERWSTTPRLAFVDAYLAALAAMRDCPVYTKNVRELRGQGVDAPDPLPASARASNGPEPSR